MLREYGVDVNVWFVVCYGLCLGWFKAWLLLFSVGLVLRIAYFLGLGCGFARLDFYGLV